MRLTLVLILAVTIAASGCVSGSGGHGVASGSASGAGPAPATVPTARYHSGGLSFRYPASWQRLRCRWIPTSFLTTAAVLTTVRPLPECPHPDVHPAAGWPVARLGPDGVVVAWSYYGFPNEFDLSAFPGRPARIGGRPARIEVRSPQHACHVLGGDQQVRVTVRRRARGNWMLMDACLRGPDLARSRADVEHMLATARVP